MKLWTNAYRAGGLGKRFVPIEPTTKKLDYKKAVVLFHAGEGTEVNDKVADLLLLQNEGLVVKKKPKEKDLVGKTVESVSGNGATAPPPFVELDAFDEEARKTALDELMEVEFYDLGAIQLNAFAFRLGFQLRQGGDIEEKRESLNKICELVCDEVDDPNKTGKGSKAAGAGGKANKSK